jgi:hypothetical protein
MPKFSNARDLEAHLKKALDATVYETIRTCQGTLGAITPRDTGRLRSSWFAAEGAASSDVAPEGTDSPNNDADGLRVDCRKPYHLTNSLPYAQRLALEEYAKADKNWFLNFVNVEIGQIQEDAANAVREKYDL